MSNRERGALVEEFILAYGEKYMDDQAPISTVITCFYADLLHLLDSYDMSWGYLFKMAQVYHHQEVEAAKNAGSNSSE